MFQTMETEMGHKYGVCSGFASLINHLDNSYYINPNNVRNQKAIRSSNYNLLVTSASSEFEPAR